MHPCPECGQDVETGNRLCPHCGAALPLSDAPLDVPAPAVWPPPPTGYGPPTPEGPGPLLTKSVRGDVVLGFVAGIALSAVLPLLGTVLLALLLKNNYPSFARGAKYSAWAQGAIILGALALCFSSLAGAGR